MNDTCAHWPLEFALQSAHLVIGTAIGPVAKNRVKPKSCAIIVRIHEQTELRR